MYDFISVIEISLSIGAGPPHRVIQLNSALHLEINRCSLHPQVQVVRYFGDFLEAIQLGRGFFVVLISRTALFEGEL